jgi:hypothetical protein
MTLCVLIQPPFTWKLNVESLWSDQVLQHHDAITKLHLFSTQGC